MTKENTQAVVVKDVTQLEVPVIIQVRAKKGFLAAGGSETRFHKEAGFAMQAIQNNPFLAKMDKQSILNAVVNVALTGLTLNPELKLGYLIPRKGKLYFMASYMGKKEIVMRSGMVKDVWVELVYEKDEFDVVGGGDRKLVHKPKHFGDRGKIVGGYWQAIYQNGEKPFGVMDVERIMEIKKRSEAVKAGKGSPWDTDEVEMMKKTILNWGFKSLPKTGISDDVLKAMEAEAVYEKEDLEDWKKAQDHDKKHSFDDDEPADDTVVSEAVIVTEEPAQDKKEQSEPKQEEKDKPASEQEPVKKSVPPRQTTLPRPGKQ